MPGVASPVRTLQRLEDGRRGYLRLCDHRRGIGRKRAGKPALGRRPHDRLRLEAGPSDWLPWIHIPAGFIKTFYHPKVNWLYSMEPSEWTGGRSIHAPRGKTLGGSSSINGHVYNRGQRMDFDTWSQFGNRGWGYADVLPYFRRLENRIGDGDPTFRGKDGALTVTDIDWIHPLCEAFIAGAVSLGIPRNPDYNGHTQEGVAYSQRTIYKGRRMSAARAFLRPAMKRGNLTVRTHAHATEILLEGKRAVGVRYAKGGQGGPLTEVRAAKELILSGGTYNSPQLLQLSGIGAAGAPPASTASRCAMRLPASARTCVTTTRRASSPASRTSRPSTSACAG